MTIVKTRIQNNLLRCPEISGKVRKFFISETGRSIASKFYEMKCETAFNRAKKVDWSTKKCLFTMMENVIQFSRSIENSVFYLFFNFFFN